MKFENFFIQNSGFDKRKGRKSTKNKHFARLSKGKRQTEASNIIKDNEELKNRVNELMSIRYQSDNKN